MSQKKPKLMMKKIMKPANSKDNMKLPSNSTKTSHQNPWNTFWELSVLIWETSETLQDSKVSNKANKMMNKKCNLKLRRVKEREKVQTPHQEKIEERTDLLFELFILSNQFCILFKFSSESTR